jgi:hypothetical protein
MATAPARRNGQALPGAFGLIPGKMRIAANVRFVPHGRHWH